MSTNTNTNNNNINNDKKFMCSVKLLLNVFFLFLFIVAWTIPIVLVLEGANKTILSSVERLSAQTSAVIVSSLEHQFRTRVTIGRSFSNWTSINGLPYKSAVNLRTYNNLVAGDLMETPSTSWSYTFIRFLDGSCSWIKRTAKDVMHSQMCRSRQGIYITGNSTLGDPDTFYDCDLMALNLTTEELLPASSPFTNMTTPAFSRSWVRAPVWNNTLANFNSHPSLPNSSVFYVGHFYVPQVDPEGLVLSLFTYSIDQFDKSQELLIMNNGLPSSSFAPILKSLLPTPEDARAFVVEPNGRVVFSSHSSPITFRDYTEGDQVDDGCFLSADRKTLACQFNISTYVEYSLLRDFLALESPSSSGGTSSSFNIADMRINESTIKSSANGEEYVASRRPIQVYSAVFTLALFTPVDYFLSDIRKATVTVIVVCVLMIIVGAVLTYFLLRVVAGRIEDLAEQMYKDPFATDQQNNRASKTQNKKESALSQKLSHLEKKRQRQNVKDSKKLADGSSGGGIMSESSGGGSDGEQNTSSRTSRNVTESSFFGSSSICALSELVELEDEFANFRLIIEQLRSFMPASLSNHHNTQEKNSSGSGSGLLTKSSSDVSQSSVLYDSSSTVPEVSIHDNNGEQRTTNHNNIESDDFNNESHDDLTNKRPINNNKVSDSTASSSGENSNSSNMNTTSQVDGIPVVYPEELQEYRKKQQQMTSSISMLSNTNGQQQINTTVELTSADAAQQLNDSNNKSDSQRSSGIGMMSANNNNDNNNSDNRTYEDSNKNSNTNETPSGSKSYDGGNDSGKSRKVVRVTRASSPGASVTEPRRLSASNDTADNRSSDKTTEIASNNNNLSTDESNNTGSTSAVADTKQQQHGSSVFGNNMKSPTAAGSSTTSGSSNNISDKPYHPSTTLYLRSALKNTSSATNINSVSGDHNQQHSSLQQYQQRFNSSTASPLAAGGSNNNNNNNNNYNSHSNLSTSVNNINIINNSTSNTTNTNSRTGDGSRIKKNVVFFGGVQVTNSAGATKTEKLNVKATKERSSTMFPGEAIGGVTTDDNNEYEEPSPEKDIALEEDDVMAESFGQPAEKAAIVKAEKRKASLATHRCLFAVISLCGTVESAERAAASTESDDDENSNATNTDRDNDDGSFQEISLNALTDAKSPDEKNDEMNEKSSSNNQNSASLLGHTPQLHHNTHNHNKKKRRKIVSSKGAGKSSSRQRKQQRQQETGFSDPNETVLVEGGYDGSNNNNNSNSTSNILGSHKNQISASFNTGGNNNNDAEMDMNNDDNHDGSPDDFIMRASSRNNKEQRQVQRRQRLLDRSRYIADIINNEVIEISGAHLIEYRNDTFLAVLRLSKREVQSRVAHRFVANLIEAAHKISHHHLQRQYNEREGKKVNAIAVYGGVSVGDARFLSLPAVTGDTVARPVTVLGPCVKEAHDVMMRMKYFAAGSSPIHPLPHAIGYLVDGSTHETLAIQSFTSKKFNPVPGLRSNRQSSTTSPSSVKSNNYKQKTGGAIIATGLGFSPDSIKTKSISGFMKDTTSQAASGTTIPFALSPGSTPPDQRRGETTATGNINDDDFDDGSEAGVSSSPSSYTTTGQATSQSSSAAKGGMLSVATTTYPQVARISSSDQIGTTRAGAVRGKKGKVKSVRRLVGPSIFPPE